MLYVSTRNDKETFTAFHALNDNRAPDGGFYTPLHMRPYTPEEVEGFARKNPNQALAELLNHLFAGQLTRWDVDFAAGRYPVRLRTMNHKITVAECWHNLDWDFSRMVKSLACLIRGSKDQSIPTGEWAVIAVRIGVLFGIFGELMREGIAGLQERVDVVVPSGDFSAVMSAWYARYLGLPIGNIVICCNENNNLWDLVYHGELRTGTIAQRTLTPECDQTVPNQLERLIYACGGSSEVETFVRCCREGRTYFPSEAVLPVLQNGLHVSVVSQRRLESTIPNAYRTHGYVFGPYSALCYAGLHDYRAKTGAGANALILSERGALCNDALVARTMSIGVSELHKILE